MSEDEFDMLLDRHGGDETRWRFTERADAPALLTGSPRARAALAAMRQVEKALDASRARGGFALDLAAITAARQQQTQFSAARLAWGAVGLAALLVGYVGGQAVAPAGAATSVVVQALDPDASHVL